MCRFSRSTWILFVAILAQKASEIDGGRLRHQDAKKEEYSVLQTADFEPNLPLLASSTAKESEETRNFVSATLGSNMVLQRDRPAMLWGFSQRGATITTILQKSNADSFDPLTTAANEDGIWRQELPVQNATMIPHTITISSTTGESTRLDNILFGDVYICGGQSNMQFAIPATTNGTLEAKLANAYPHMRLFTVGQKTSSPDRALLDLQTVEQPWTTANEYSLMSYGDEYFGFGYFSAVCWLFGREIADGLNNSVPIGLVSNNWGGQKVQVFQPGGALFNSMIHPYLVGPMAVSGFTWYQGEANVQNQTTANEYALLFPQMIQQWRQGFQHPEAYFGFVQLSTWCPKPENIEGLAALRRAQMAALELKNVGYATNADHGAGCNIHPPPKQYCAKRLAKSALALQYGQEYVHWKSPSYVQAEALKYTVGMDSLSVVVQLKDVSPQGLYVIDKSYNGMVKDFDCGSQVPGTCAWASIKLAKTGWVNAAISVQVPSKIVLTAISPVSSDIAIVETSYGWGAVPMLTIYDAGTGLPVLPWKEQVRHVNTAELMKR